MVLCLPSGCSHPRAVANPLQGSGAKDKLLEASPFQWVEVEQERTYAAASSNACAAIHRGPKEKTWQVVLHIEDIEDPWYVGRGSLGACVRKANGQDLFVLLPKLKAVQVVLVC